MIRTAKNIQELNSYKPGKTIEQIVKELGLKETAVLWNNENNFGASPKAIAAVKKELENSYLYPDPLSINLRSKIAERVGKKVENIIVGNGSESLLMNIVKAFCSGDDEILTSEGSFVMIYVWAKVNNSECNLVPLTSDYRYDIDGIIKRINPKTKIVYLSNANNPTGAMITKKEIERLMQHVPKEVLVIFDEAYFEYSIALNKDFPDGVKLNYPNAITLRTFSKSYGIAGNRIGYGIAPANIIEPLIKVKLTFEPSNLAQAAGIGALDDEAYLKKVTENNNAGIQYFYAEFDKLNLKFIPSFANFIMIDFETEKKAQAIFNALMQKGVFVRPLPAFGLPHCIRISVGRPEENKLCIEKLKEVL